MSGKLGERIRKIRKLLKMSQDEFGLKLGVSQSRQSRIEKDEIEIPTSYVNKVVQIFGEFFNEEWLYMNVGHITQNQVKDDPGVNYFDNIDKENLTPGEEELLGEVEQFSDFLKKKDLKPRLKRILLERLIDSIDQALDQPQDKE